MQVINKSNLYCYKTTAICEFVFDSSSFDYRVFTSLIIGFAERLQRELSQKFPSSRVVQVPSYRKYLVIFQDLRFKIFARPLR